MTNAQIVVTLVGLVAIVWVNYWFFWGDRDRTEPLSPRAKRGGHSSAPSLRSG